jgi:hypothetical protein
LLPLAEIAVSLWGLKQGIDYDRRQKAVEEERQA